MARKNTVFPPRLDEDGRPYGRKRILKRMAELGIDRKQLSRLSGVSPSTLDAIIYGSLDIQHMSFRNAYAVLKTLRIDPDLLLEDDF